MYGDYFNHLCPVEILAVRSYSYLVTAGLIGHDDVENPFRYVRNAYSLSLSCLEHDTVSFLFVILASTPLNGRGIRLLTVYTPYQLLYRHLAPCERFELPDRSRGQQFSRLTLLPAKVTRHVCNWRSQRDSNPHFPVRSRTVYPLAYAILLLPLRLELRYTGMALTPADGDGSIGWKGETRTLDHRFIRTAL